MGESLARLALLPERFSNGEGRETVSLPQRISLAARCNSRWCARQSGTVYSSLTLRPSARGLGKWQVMGVGRLFGADQTGLVGHEAKVFLVAVAHGLGDGELAGAPAVTRSQRFLRGARIGLSAMAPCGDELDRPR